MVRIGIIETGQPQDVFAARHGYFPDMFKNYFSGAQGLTFSTHQVFKGARIPDPKDCDAWIITGSPYGVYESHAWLPPLMGMVRATLENDRPMLGICFGHQLMAQACGGQVVQSDRGWGIGVHEYALTDAGQAMIMPEEKLNLLAMHQDQVVKLPANGTVLAQSIFCPYAAIAYGASGLSFQGHPEFTAAFERDLISSRRDDGIIPGQIADAGLSTLDNSRVDAENLAPILARFLRRG